MITATIAYTTFPNSINTDKLSQIWHTVHYYLNGGSQQELYVIAKDPQHAIDKVNKMNEMDIKTYSNKPEQI